MRVLRPLRWVAAAALGTCLVLPAAALIGGYHADQVDGTSMQPTYERGDVLLDRHENGLPRVGDVVRVHRAGAKDAGFTHRVIEVDTARGIRTQGDNEAYPETGWTHPDEIAGTVQLHLGGWVARAWKVLEWRIQAGPQAVFPTLSAVLFALVWLVWPTRRRRSRKPAAARQSRRTAHTAPARTDGATVTRRQLREAAAGR